MFQSIKPVLAEVLLFVPPKVVEQGLVIHIHGNEHAVADPLGHCGIGFEARSLGRLTRPEPVRASLVTVSFFHWL